MLVLASCVTALEPEQSAVDSETSWIIPSGDWKQVVLGPGMPAQVTTDLSNNNLDVGLYEGRVYLAFRTAPSHFASDDTSLYVVSTPDLEHFADWQYELQMHTGKDLREPRFLFLKTNCTCIT